MNHQSNLIIFALITCFFFLNGKQMHFTFGFYSQLCQESIFLLRWLMIQMYCLCCRRSVSLLLSYTSLCSAVLSSEEDD